MTKSVGEESTEVRAVHESGNSGTPIYARRDKTVQGVLK
jgi:hypothetical protein